MISRIMSHFVCALNRNYEMVVTPVIRELKKQEFAYGKFSKMFQNNYPI
jgi:hypothetical protein